MRIVSLLPSATEILFAIGAGDELAGVTHECDYPPQARVLPVLTRSALPAAGSPADIDRHVRASVHEGSSLYHLDAELLERLNPDLIVTQELCAVCAVSYETVDRAVKRLRGDPRIVSLEPNWLGDVLQTMLYLGDVTSHAEGARRAVGELRARIDAMRAQTAARDVRPRVLLLEWTEPPMSAGHWIPDLIELAGAVPVLASPGSNSVTLEWQAIAASDPDAVVVAPCGLDAAASAAATAALDAVLQWTSLRAYREERIFAMDGNAYVSRPGPRVVESAEIIRAWLEAPSGSPLR